MEGVEERRLQHYLIDVFLSLGYDVVFNPTQHPGLMDDMIS